MKNLSLIKKFLYSLFLLQMVAFNLFSQVKYIVKDNVNLAINGTSSLHDWTMKSAKGSGDVIFTFAADGKITGCSSIFFLTPVADLKSDHSGLDKNAYKALKKDKNPNISFVANQVDITAGTANTYTLKCTGKLTVAGVTKETELIAAVKKNADKSIVVSGIKSINMLEWNVVPPSFMFGAMKTGKDIKLNFEVTTATK